MSGTVIVIGEILVGILQIIALRAKAAGMTEDEVRRMLVESVEKVKLTTPETLPDV